MNSLVQTFRRARDKAGPTKKGTGDKKRIDPNAVTEPLDSWDPKYRPLEAEKLAVESKRERARARTKATSTVAKEAVAKEVVATSLEAAPDIKAELSKKRVLQISFAVSEEEKVLIKEYAEKRNLSFSHWIRQIVFAAMEQPIPNRPR